MEVTLSSTSATQELAEKIARNLKSGDVVLLKGNLGTGKTTFTGFLVKGLGITARVQSPTFVLMRKYLRVPPLTSHINTVNHLDLYRITSEHELEDLGLFEILSESQAVSVIEWPELIPDIANHRVIELSFYDIDETSRKVLISGISLTQ